MVDIWGRTTRGKPSEGKTTDEVKKIIKDEIATNFNLVSIDPGEIVVFENEQGKLKTSNISFDSLLTKPEGVADDSIAVFKDGKITARDKLSSITDKLTVVKDTADDLKLFIDDLAKFFVSPRQTMDVQIAHVKAVIDNLAKLQTAYDNHLKTFSNFRNNIVEKFLGDNVKPKDVTPTLAEIKTKFTNIDAAQKKSTDDIVDIYSHLGVWVDTNPITASIANIKQDITNILKITDKVKIPDEAKDIKNLTYVVEYGVKDWVSLDNTNDDIMGSSLIILNKINLIGIYRFTVISKHQFNIEVDHDTPQGVNTVMIFVDDNEDPRKRTILLTSVNATVVRASVRWVLEYISPID